MNNNMGFNGYGYPDMNLLNNIFIEKNSNNQHTVNSNMVGEQSLASPYEAFMKGNLYNNLYEQYKNYQPAKLVPNNEQAELLLNVGQLTFVAHELNLYLDIYPNDKDMIKLFNEYQKKANDAINTYEKKYGPLTVSFLSNDDTFSWEAYAWPWEMEEL